MRKKLIRLSFYNWQLAPTNLSKPSQTTLNNDAREQTKGKIMTTIHSTIQLTPATPTRTHRLLFPALRCSAKQTKHQAPGKKFDKGSPPSPTSNKKILSPKLTTTTTPPPPLPLPPVHLSLRTYTSSVRSLSRSVNQFLVTFSETGTSANAGPHYQKLYARVTHIWGNRGGQSNRSAMRGPRPGRTALVITVPPASGKYA